MQTQPGQPLRGKRVAVELNVHGARAEEFDQALLQELVETAEAGA